MQIFFVFFDGKPKNVVKPTPESHESCTGVLVPESNPAFKGRERRNPGLK